MLKQSPKQTAIARKLRKADTWAEQLMWRWLRDRRFSAHKFRRQQPMGPHILDFYCAAAQVNIELDGTQHGHPGINRRMRHATPGWASAGSRCCGFGTDAFAGRRR